MIKFFQEGSQLLIISDSGTVVWKGNPMNWAVAQVIEIPNSDSAIVLLDYYNWDTNRGYNLIRVDSHGEILWQATERGGHLSGDVITGINVENGCIFANTWNCCRLRVDEKNGRMLFLCITK